MLPQAESSRLIVPEALDQLVEGALDQVQPHDLDRLGGRITGLFSGTERQPGLGNIEASRHDEFWRVREEDRKERVRRCEQGRMAA
jgi:hypothetical protein